MSYCIYINLTFHVTCITGLD